MKRVAGLTALVLLGLGMLGTAAWGILALHFALPESFDINNAAAWLYGLLALGSLAGLAFPRDERSASYLRSRETI